MMDVEISFEDFIKKFSSSCKGVQKKFFKKNQVITTYIKKRNLVYILLRGEADLVRYDFNGAKTIIEHYTENTVFGEVFYTISVNNELSVEAKKNSEVLIFSYDNIFNQCDASCEFHHVLQAYFTKILVKKMKYVNTRVEILTKRTIREKLIGYFNILSTRNFSKTFVIPFSLTDLADYLSVDRSAMMREIKNLKNDGIIEKDGNKFTLRTM